MGNLWNDLVKVFEDARGSCNVIHRALSLGTRDDETGWRAKNYAESTIKMVIILKGATKLQLMAGSYVRLDALGLTNTSVKESDEIKVGASIYYEVKAIREMCVTPDTIEYYEVDLTKLPLHD